MVTRGRYVGPGYSDPPHAAHKRVPPSSPALVAPVSTEALASEGDVAAERATALACAAAVAQAAEEAAVAAREAHHALAVSGPEPAHASVESSCTLVGAMAAGQAVHLMMKHGAPWRGSYARVLKLTPTGLQTLSSNAEVTNTWAWNDVMGARRVNGKPCEMELVVSQPVLPRRGLPHPSGLSQQQPLSRPSTSAADPALDESPPCLETPLGALINMTGTALARVTWPTAMRGTL